MNYKEMINFLESIPKFGKKDGLENTKRLMKKLNNPEKRLKYIHVAGTNGKGSVCSFLSSILIEEGYNVGLFTSPHLVKYNERIRLNNTYISDEDLVHCFEIIFEKCRELVEEGFPHPTFFEVIFAAAILFFSSNNADFIVLETGLGGRLDATNVIDKPLVSVITPIGLDHTSILGNTLEEIALEKAGIIKQDCPLVYVKQYNEVDSIIQLQIKGKNVKLYIIDKINYKILNKSNKSIDFSLNTSYYNYNSININSLALYQITNVAIALTVVEVLILQGIILRTDKILIGITKAKWPGRMDFIEDNIILEGAHNEIGMVEYLKNINNFLSNKKHILIFTSLVDKPYENMIKLLCNEKCFEKIIITKPNSNRATSCQEIYNCFKKCQFKDLVIIEDVTEAFLYGKSLLNDETILTCIGSLYLIGDIYKIKAII